MDHIMRVKVKWRTKCCFRCFATNTALGGCEGTNGGCGLCAAMLGVVRTVILLQCGSGTHDDRSYFGKRGMVAIRNVMLVQMHIAKSLMTVP